MASEWMQDALCTTETFREVAILAGIRSSATEVFYPVLETDDGKPVTNKPRHKMYKQREARFERIARATCAECPVRLDCLFEELELATEPHGIVGGLDVASRAALLESDNPVILQGQCQCGITLFGVEGTMPKACSANCRGEK